MEIAYKIGLSLSVCIQSVLMLYLFRKGRYKTFVNGDGEWKGSPMGLVILAIAVAFSLVGQYCAKQFDSRVIDAVMSILEVAYWVLVALATLYSFGILKEKKR